MRYSGRWKVQALSLLFEPRILYAKHKFICKNIKIATNGMSKLVIFKI